MHVGKAGTNYAADSLHALSWQGCICYKHGLSSPFTQVHLQQLQSRLVWRDSSKVQALNHSADSKRSTAKGSKPSNKQQQQQKQKQWRRQSNTRLVPSSRPAENKSARTKKVPLHVQIEELLEECKAHQHWAPTPGPAVQHSDQGQGRHRTESASAGREALSKLLRLAELCSLWDTAQGQAARQQALATSLSAAPSAHTARIAHPHEAARLASNAPTSSATPFGASGTNRQGTGAASASRPQGMGVNRRSGWHEEHMHQGPVLGPLQAPGQHTLPGPPWISTPPDLPTRMGACADRLLAAIALYVSPSPTPSSPSAATLLDTWSHTVIPSEQERQGGATAGLAPIPVHPSQASLAPLPNDSNPTDRTPHITLNQHSASFAWDIESASQLAHAMAATQRYHAGLCAHVERATVQHAQAHGRVEIRCAARIMAAWAKLGHAPSQASLAALLHASGAAMHEMAASLAPTPAAPLPRAPTGPLHSRNPSSLPNPALLRAMPQQTPPSGPQPPTHTPTLQASGWATDQAAAPAIAPATAQATGPAHSPKLSSSSGQAIHLAATPAVTPAAAQGSAPAHSRKLQASSDPDIALASAPAVAPASAPAQSHKLQASARAIADLAWAASQLDSWEARVGSGSRTVVGYAGRAASTPPPSPLTWVNRGTGGGGKRSDGSGSSDSTDKQTNVRSSVGDVGWGGGAGSCLAPTAAPLNAALLLLPSHGARPSSAPAMAAHTTTATAAALAEAADDGYGSGGLQAHTGGDGRIAPLDLAQAQQAWLEALQQCSLPHLPALNLAAEAKCVPETKPVQSGKQSPDKRVGGLAQAQQAWLDALQQRSLPHLPALNLAGEHRDCRLSAL
ncbi:hypothetical protein DUNSADRAFT_5277 [Dunaliella salina]|uniref:Uncharacterized protein n=1 Tax=Dunaliella salina TaxID=3046 RepID=A0ABQ7GQJ9_DUNSA|nr:hypothetical protein DUNSADRAFT_5277 [Dunaliella salina]|eukprot:KAF5836885.1 hypothetical protein DUNSADRAFT_5277 [Dunaliella salina]